MICPLRPWAASAHSRTALTWGYPTPVCDLVVQTEPKARDKNFRNKNKISFFSYLHQSFRFVSATPLKNPLRYPSHANFFTVPLHTSYLLKWYSILTWSNANFDYICSTQNQLLNHFSSHNVSSLNSKVQKDKEISRDLDSEVFNICLQFFYSCQKLLNAYLLEINNSQKSK